MITGTRQLYLYSIQFQLLIASSEIRQSGIDTDALVEFQLLIASSEILPLSDSAAAGLLFQLLIASSEMILW